MVLLTAVPLALGLTATAIVARWWSGVIRPAQLVGCVLAVATIGLTLTSDFDAESTVALSLTRLALVPFIVFGLQALRRP